MAVPYADADLPPPVTTTAPPPPVPAAIDPAKTAAVGIAFFLALLLFGP